MENLIAILRQNLLRITKIKYIAGLLLLLSSTGFAFVAEPESELQQPDLPAICSGLRIGLGNNQSFKVYAQGVQIYRWSGTAWDFVAPEADLFANAGFDGKVGIHYAGPTWESNSGSKVIAARVTGCAPDSTAIPWLLLKTVSANGPGIFNKVTYIQRLNTTGGLAPAAPGSKIGQVARVPYTAIYYFYRTKE